MSFIYFFVFFGCNDSVWNMHSKINNTCIIVDTIFRIFITYVNCILNYVVDFFNFVEEWLLIYYCLRPSKVI